MKRIINQYTLLMLLLVASFISCKKEYGNLNGPTIEDYSKNASIGQLNGLVTGTLSGMRNSIGTYLDAVSVIGREIYRFSNADPRFVSELLGQDQTTLNNTGFYLTNPWAARYRTIKNCNVLIEAATNSTQISDAERKGYTGLAKTLKAHELLMNLNLTYTNGVRIEVADPNNLGPFLTYDQSIAEIATLLEAGKTELTGSSVIFPLSDGFLGFKDAAGLVKFNRALAARVAVYRQQWAAAATALTESFFNPNGAINLGVFNVFGTGTGDQLNSAFFPQNNAGEVRVAQPKFITDMAANDDRAAKATIRTAAASNAGLSSNWDVWVYTSSTAPIPIIRNEELMLINVEVKINQNSLPDAVLAIDKIRALHNLTPYAGAVTAAALTNEMLNQRRYSLFFEGHRWVDMRRYNKLAELPIDRPNDDVWTLMPIPQTEGN